MVNPPFPLSALDNSFFCLHSDTRPQHIAALAIFDRKIPLDILEKNLENVSKNYPRIQSTLGPIPRIMESYELEEDINNSVMKVLNSAFIRPEKLWDLHSFYHPASGKNYLLFKLHHSLSDGLNGLEFFHNFILGNSKPLNLPTRSVTRIPILKTLKTLCYEIFSKSAPLSNSAIETPYRTLLTFSIPYSKIQKLKNLNKCTSMAIALTITSKIIESLFEGLKNYRALVPIALDPKFKNPNLGNNIGAASININLELKSIELLINEISTELLKRLNGGGFGSYLFLSNILNLLPTKIARFFVHLAAGKITAINTSLIGPRSKVFVGDSELIEEYAIPALMPGQHIGFGFLKFRNKLNFAIILDTNIKNPLTENKIHNVLEKLDITP